MKIMHCCLSSWYVDGYSYQENILPKMHALQGHDVYIIASTETYIDHKYIGYLPPSSYQTEYDVPIQRLAYKKIFNHFITKKLRFYKGLTKEIEFFEPEIIFIHSHHFLSIYEIKKYAKKYPHVKIFIDSHCDYINCAKTWLSKNILHKILYKWCAKTIEPYTVKFYGTLPIRCEFLHKMYGISKEKIEFLPLGVDDSINIMQTSLPIKKGDCFVIITGGRIEKRKNILRLMRVIKNLDVDDIKLVIFGSLTDEIRDEFEQIIGTQIKQTYTDNFCDDHAKLLWEKKIIYLGWLKPSDIYNFFKIVDLAIFPGTHSVLWEQAVGCGLPCIFKYMKGVTHIDLGGNCRFLYEETSEELRDMILRLYHDRDELNGMKNVAQKKGTEFFSYKQITQRSIS